MNKGKGKDEGEQLVNPIMQRANQITVVPRLDSAVGMEQKHLPSENVDGILIQHVMGIDDVA